MARFVRELKGFRRMHADRDLLEFHELHVAYTVDSVLFKVWGGPNYAEELKAQLEVTSMKFSPPTEFRC